ncbi:hypothetical protein [Curtobacterium oceanosedimentum]|uniref:hypothetical protein n=1 Tax=Curtobacterium oceanosedimentum TaxID=465820 RepID=UPI003390D1CB
MTGASTQDQRGWRSTGRAAVYWVLAGLGVLGGAATWLFLFLMTEEATRGATPDRSGPNPNSGLAFGGLLVGHVVGLVVLVLAAQWARRDPRSAARFAAVAFLADSLLGLVLSLLTTGGALVAPWPQRPYQP